MIEPLSNQLENQINPHLRKIPSLRILVAEDNLVNQKVILLVLGKIGYRADIALNGLDVLDALHRQVYDIILMDIQMPEMDGLETSRYICQKWSADLRPYIIAMTANKMPGDRDACLAAGMDDYISKPVKIEELAAALRRCKFPDQVELANNSQLLVLDSQALHSLENMMNGNQSAVIALINCYLTEAPKLVQVILDASKIADFPTLWPAAHNLKSSSATLGANCLAALCQELERYGRNGDMIKIGAQVISLQLEYNLVKAALEKLTQEKC